MTAAKSREELASAQDDAIRDVIQRQEAHGLPVVTDGEFRRHSFQESFSECVTGFEVPKSISLYYEKRDLNETPLERAEQNFDEAGPAIITRRGAAERLKLMRNLPLEEFHYAQSVCQSTSQGYRARPGPYSPTLQVGSLAERLQRPRRFRRSHHSNRTPSKIISELVAADASTFRSTRRAIPRMSTELAWSACGSRGSDRNEISPVHRRR